MTIVDRNAGKSIDKIETVTKTPTKNKVLVSTETTYRVLVEGTDEVLGDFPSLAKAREAIGKVLRHPEPTSKPKGDYKGPAKGNSPEAKKTKGKGK